MFRKARTGGTAYEILCRCPQRRPASRSVQRSHAGNQAFPILAGCIFGKNKGEKKFAMTAPVTQAAVPVKLEMTAPVTQTAAPGGFLVQFVLPKGVTVALGANDGIVSTTSLVLGVAAAGAV
jgi:hypothetical protein